MRCDGLQFVVTQIVNSSSSVCSLILCQIRFEHNLNESHSLWSNEIGFSSKLAADHVMPNIDFTANRLCLGIRCLVKSSAVRITRPMLPKTAAPIRKIPPKRLDSNKQNKSACFVAPTSQTAPKRPAENLKLHHKLLFSRRKNPIIIATDRNRLT